MTQSLLRAASQSPGAGKPPGGYNIISSLKVGAGPMWRQEGFQSPDPEVEKGNYREMLKVLEERVGCCVLIADMKG